MIWVVAGLVLLLITLRILSRTPNQNFPRICVLCRDEMVDEDDMTRWHGYGNCVPLDRDIDRQS